MLPNLLAKLLICLKTIRMISNCRFHYKAKTMQYTSELSIWDLQQVSLPELSSIQVLSIWQLQVFSVMMRQLETINLRNMIHCQEALWQEIKCIKDAKQWLMTCTNQIQIKFSQRPLQNLHMVQQNCKVLSGKTIHAFSHSRVLQVTEFN